MRSIQRAGIPLAIVGLVAAACSTGAATPSAKAGSPTQVASVAAPSVPVIATAIPMTDGAGPEYVVGTSDLTVTKAGTETVVGGVTQLRGQEMSDTGKMNDPRLAGTSHVTLNLDGYGTVAAEWGTSRIENAGGAWEGTWTGASWNGGNATAVSGWLIGSGSYAGYTYYFHAYGPVMPFRVEGIIFAGSPPTP